MKLNFETMLSGSHVNFKQRERPPLTDQERELKLENERKLQEGIRFLRKLRTQALEAEDLVACQNILHKAHEFSHQMAEVILSQALARAPSIIDPSFLEILNRAKVEYADQEADSGHGLPPQFSVTNLFRAIDDMLVRVEERASSMETPSHKLTQEELRYVLEEFLRGTNDLSINAMEKFFEPDTRVGSILTGGSVYAELVKKIVEKYGDTSLAVNSFVIAVDKEHERAVIEFVESDIPIRTVVVTDDVIDTGGTLLAALWSVGEQYPDATIYSGKGTDQPGGFEKRRKQGHMNHLEALFQDFADLTEENRNDDALALFSQAEQYALENKVALQPGWYKRKERIGKQNAQ